MTLSDALILIDEIHKQKYTPNEWETKFMYSIKMQKWNLSYKQSLALNKIYEKSVGARQYQKKQYIRGA